MVYVLKAYDHDFALVGTPGWVAAWRKRVADLVGVDPKTGRRYPYPLMRRAKVMGVLAGGDAEAEAVRLRFAHPDTAASSLLAGMVPVTPALWQWLAEHGRPWDGHTDAEVLKVKGVSKPVREYKVPVKVGLGDRLARRRNF